MPKSPQEIIKSISWYQIVNNQTYRKTTTDLIREKLQFCSNQYLPYVMARLQQIQFINDLHALNNLSMQLEHIFQNKTKAANSLNLELKNTFNQFYNQFNHRISLKVSQPTKYLNLRVQNQQIMFNNLPPHIDINRYELLLIIVGLNFEIVNPNKSLDTSIYELNQIRRYHQTKTPEIKPIVGMVMELNHFYKIIRKRFIKYYQKHLLRPLYKPVIKYIQQYEYITYNELNRFILKQ